MYKRIIEDKIRNSFFKEQIIVIYGPRQVGKTTMVKKFFEEYQGPKMYFQADIPSDKEVFSIPEPEKIMKKIGNSTLIIIDEAQLIENIGVTLKVLYDTHKEIQIIVTGSSSFDLANKIREPLTGRALEFMLYPLSYEEIVNHNNVLYFDKHFEHYLKYGFYPAIHELNESDARMRLNILQNNTLYKDIFVLDNIRKPKVLSDMTLFIARNIGTVVKIGNIAREIKTTEKTVERYLDLLEKMFIIIKIKSFSRNPNNELKNGYKIYFTDIGLRNSIIDNFNAMELRIDKGALFENFFIVERIKYLSNNFIFKNKFFWQDYSQIEVDYLEEGDGFLDIFECKYGSKKSRSLSVFKKRYEETRNMNLISVENYMDFLKNM